MNSYKWPLYLTRIELKENNRESLLCDLQRKDFKQDYLQSRLFTLPCLISS